MEPTRSIFPDDFVWGTATSAYQIEGSPLADGAGPSNWHEFAHTPGRIFENQHGDTACDHYRRWREDVRLIRELGVGAYRFSIAWARVFPEGRGHVNSHGLAFYDRLVDALLEANIQPHATLFHWDLPMALEREGGWLNPHAPTWFADYAQTVVSLLADRVTSWCTINEPWVIANHGYVDGIHPPGRRNLGEFPVVVRHLLLAHQEATHVSRAAGANNVGLVVNLTPQHAWSDSAEHTAAAARCHAYVNRLFLDPVLLGRYPDEVKQMFSDEGMSWPEDQLDCQRGSIDFLGVNYYLRNVVRAAMAKPTRAEEFIVPDRPRSAMGWEIYPEGLTDILCWVKQTYGDFPVYVTENGVALDDPPPINGTIQDDGRISYLRQHFAAAAAAIEKGVDLRGFFVWSLMDNFEWSFGYSKRFGIVHVDPNTQQRSPKASARFYSRWIRGDF